jgi:hypothetical protein
MPGMTVGFGPPAQNANGTLGAQGVYTPTSWVSGNAFSTVRVVLGGTWTGTVKFQMTMDSTGTNWINTPGAQRLDVVSANPAISFATTASGIVAIGDPIATANGTYEIPIPGNCTGVRVIMGAYTSGSATVLIGPSKLYVPGVPVTAILYDVTEGSIGAGFSAGTLDISGWSNVTVDMTNPTGQTVFIKEVDDTGTKVFNGATGTAAGANTITLTRSGGGPIQTGLVGASSYATYNVTWRRIDVTLAAGGSVTTGRARVSVSR